MQRSRGGVTPTPFAAGGGHGVAPLTITTAIDGLGAGGGGLYNRAGGTPTRSTSMVGGGLNGSFVNEDGVVERDTACGATTPSAAALRLVAAVASPSSSNAYGVGGADGAVVDTNDREGADVVIGGDRHATDTATGTKDSSPSSKTAGGGDSFPFTQKLLICNVLLVDSTADSMLFSYVGLLIAHLDPSFSRSSAGYASGVLLGLYQAAQFFALPRWGRLSDGIGRKPVLKASLVLCCAVSLLFGSSRSLTQALVARLLHGSVIAGNITIKSYVAETTNERTAAAAFSMVSLARAVGGAIGPLVGGILYDPTNPSSPLAALFRGPKSPRSSLSLTDDGGSMWYHLFSERPALLPALALAVYASMVFVMVHLWLKESNVNAQRIALPSYGVLWGRARVQCRHAYNRVLSFGSSNRRRSDYGAGALLGPSPSEEGSFLLGVAANAPASSLAVVPSPNNHSASVRGPSHYQHGNAAYPTLATPHANTNANANAMGGSIQRCGSSNMTVDALDNVSMVSRGSTLSALTNNTATPRSHTPSLPRGVHGAGPVPTVVGGGGGSSVVVSGENALATHGNGNSGSVISIGSSPSSVVLASSHAVAAGAINNGTTTTPLDASIPIPLHQQPQQQQLGAAPYAPAKYAHLPLAEQLAMANAQLNAQPSVSYSDVWAHPILRVLTPMYAALTSFNIWFMEVFPLYCIAYRADGGLGLGSSQVSVLLTMVAVANFVGNLFFSKVLARVGLMPLWRWGCFASALTIATTPLVGTLTRSDTSFAVIAALFVVPTIIRVFTTIWCFSMNTMFFTNVAPKKHLGAVTSMSYASGAGARALAPMIAAPLFAWSISGSAGNSSGVVGDDGQHLHHRHSSSEYTSFILCGLLAMVCLALSLRLDSALVGKRHP